MTTPPVHVTLLTRIGCHLCEQARATVIEVIDGRHVNWSEIDVDTDPDLRAEYGDLVPVVLVDGVVVGHFQIDQGPLVAAIDGH